MSRDTRLHQTLDVGIAVTAFAGWHRGRGLGDASRELVARVRIAKGRHCQRERLAADPERGGVGGPKMIRPDRTVHIRDIGIRQCVGGSVGSA